MKAASMCFLLIAISSSVSAEEKLSGQAALTLLQEGNGRFSGEKAIHKGEDQKTRLDLLIEQKPHTVVISCSDSYVSPEVAFDQGLGQIYSVRTAGEVLDAKAIGSVEYAIQYLGVRLVVVLGHEACWAVKSALEEPSHSSESSDIDGIVNVIRPGVERFKNSISDPLLTAPVKANVFAMTKYLIQHSKVVREKIEKENLSVVQGLYLMKTGKVQFSEDVGKFYLHTSSAEPLQRKTASKQGVKKEKKKKKEKKPEASSNPWQSQTGNSYE